MVPTKKIPPCQSCNEILHLYTGYSVLGCPTKQVFVLLLLVHGATRLDEGDEVMELSAYFLSVTGSSVMAAVAAGWAGSCSPEQGGKLNDNVLA